MNARNASDFPTCGAIFLSAVLSVLAFRFLQLALGIVDLLFAFSIVIVIAVHRPRGRYVVTQPSARTTGETSNSRPRQY